MRIKTFILVLLMSIASCEKEATVKKHLSEPPVLKGFILRDHVGALIKQVGTPNVKYAKDKKSLEDNKSYVINSLIVHNNFQTLRVFFEKIPAKKVTITIVEGVLSKAIENELNISNTVLQNRNHILFQHDYTVFPAVGGGGQVAIDLSFITKKGVFRVYTDFGEYVLYDNIIIQ